VHGKTYIQSIQGERVMIREPKSIGAKSAAVNCSRAALASLILMLAAQDVSAAQANTRARIDVSVDASGGALMTGTATQFVVRVRNRGSADAITDRLVVPIPSGLSRLSWVCSATADSHCESANGAGALDASLEGLRPGSMLEYAFRADLESAAPAYVDIVASAKLSAGADCADGETAPCRASLSLPTGPAIMLDIDSSAIALAPGQQVHYTISASAVDTRKSTSGTVLRSPVPDGLINSSWRCQSSVGACPAASGQGSIEQSVGDFSRGDLRFDVVATVASEPPATIVQSALAFPPFGGSCALAQQNGAMLFRAGPCAARRALATSARILVSSSEDYRAEATSIARRFVLDNLGGSADGSVVDVSPAADVSRLEWACSGYGATCPQVNGTGAIHQTVASWPASGRLVYDLVSHVASSTMRSPKNSVQVTPSARGTCAPGATPPPCQDVASIQPENAGLHLEQSVDSLGARPGATVNYRVNIGNAAAAGSASNVVLSVPLPDGIDAFLSWTCSAAASSATACPVTSGTGPIRQLYASLAPSSNLSYAIQARVAPLAPATISATATLTAPASASLGCSSARGGNEACVATSRFSTVPVLALEQSMSADSLKPGSTVDYGFDVFNLGADADRVQIRNPLPKGVANGSWNCDGLGADCPATSGTGDISSKLTRMPTGSGVHYSVSAKVDNSQPVSATSLLTAIPESGGRCQRADGTFGAPPCIGRSISSYAPRIELKQSAAEQQALRGGTIRHTLMLRNLGGSTQGTVLSLPLAAGMQRSDWTCIGYGGAVCPQTSGSGAISASFASLPFNASVTYSIRSVLATDAPLMISSVATTTPGAKAQCADFGCASTLNLAVADVPSAHLQATVESVEKLAKPGGLVNWVVDIRNLGSEVAGRFLVDGVAAANDLSILNWSCEGVECPAKSGVGAIHETIESLSVYDPTSSDGSVSTGRLVYTVQGKLGNSAHSEAELAVTLHPRAGDTCASPSCLASSVVPDEISGVPTVLLDLTTKYPYAFPGDTIAYDFTITNDGGGTISSLPVYSVDPPGFTSSSWTCTGIGTTCTPSGTGEINEVIASLPISSFVVFTVTGQLAGTLPPSLDYLVGVNPAPPTACDPLSCTTSVSIPSVDQYALSLNANTSVVLPDSTVEYTFTVVNAGGLDSFGIQVAALEPPDVVSSSWTCQSNGGAECITSGTGPLNETISLLPPGGSATFTISATFGSVLQPTIDYQLSVSPAGQGRVPDGILFCVPASCTTTLSLPGGLQPPATFSVTKTADRTVLQRGGPVRYTVRFANTGSVDANSVRLIDPMPTGIESFSWTCASTGGISCNQGSGSGSLNELFNTVPAGASITYTVDAAVAATASGNVSNRAQVFADNIVCNPSSCQAVSSLPVEPPAAIVVSKSASPPSGANVSPGQPITWTLSALNAGGATTTSLQLRDALPISVSDILVAPDAGVTCDNLTPAPGSNLTCTIPPGFTMQRNVTISATVAAGAVGAVANSVVATGVAGVQCSACSVSNPLGQTIDVALVNPRPFSAAGIDGTLLDVVNLSSTIPSAVTLFINPASAVRLVSAYSSGCTATSGPDGSVNVACPSPPDTQGISCDSSTCEIGEIPRGSAATVFVALNQSSTATVQVSAAGDADGPNNSIVLPVGETP
jgi:uncharacterized repeat protein (TIGR01451 family)